MHKFKERHYELEKTLRDGVPTEEHPLKTLTVVTKDLVKKGQAPNVSEASSGRQTPVRGSQQLVEYDPLSGASATSGPAILDPLNAILQESISTTKKVALNTSEAGIRTSTVVGNVDTTRAALLGMEPWSSRRSSILSRYTTSEKLSIVSSFLTAQAGDQVRVLPSTNPAAAASQGGSIFDRMRSQLAQPAGGGPASDPVEMVDSCMREMSNLTAQDFTLRVQELQHALLSAWETDQRVRALQIVIQCTKLLSNTSVALTFYPSKFVVVTDVLDTFGELVYNRLRDKSATTPRGAKAPIPLPENFKPDQIPEAAKETARNWFFKIASIRELLPRLYVEAAILSSYKFLDPKEIPSILSRLMNMVRGIADPLVASYARCYLARVGVLLFPAHKDYLKDGFRDFLVTSSQFQAEFVVRQLSQQHMSMSTYMTLYLPALDWLLQCLCLGRNDLMEHILTQCEKSNNGLLLNSVLSSFAPSVISERALDLVSMIQCVDDTSYPKHLMYHQLGVCLVLSPPSEEQDRQSILRDVWRAISTLTLSPKEFCQLADAWTEFIVTFFQKRQLAALLADVIRHVLPDAVYESLSPQLLSILHKILGHTVDFHSLFDTEEFLHFLELFSKEHIRMEAHRAVLEAFLKTQAQRNTTGEPLRDPITIRVCVALARRVHDSFNAMSPLENRRVLAKLVVDLIALVDFEDNSVDKLLEWYVECRGAFFGLEPVVELLVHRVNALASRTHRLRGGQHSVKTASFVHACCAFSFISIPSLTVTGTKMSLYVLTAQTALVCGCLGQADACLKLAISLLHESGKNNTPLLTRQGTESGGGGRPRGNSQLQEEAFLLRWVGSLCSTLLMCPDGGVEDTRLYLLKGFCNVMASFSGCAAHTDTRGLILCKVVALLMALAQPVYLYHADRTPANDTLYGWAPEYLSEVASLFQTVTEQLCTLIRDLAASGAQTAQFSVAEELACVLLAGARMEDADNRRVLHYALQNTAQAAGKTSTRGRWMVQELEGWLKKAYESQDKQSVTFWRTCLAVLVG